MAEKPLQVRNYGTIVYPESAPDNWLDIVEELAIPCFVSPLHDSDIDGDGNPKKPHFHLMFMFGGKKTSKQFLEIVKQFGGVGWKQLDDLRGAARYLCHLDSRNKALYEISDVLSFGGADYIETISCMADKFGAIADMQDYVDATKCYSYAALCRYARQAKPDWYRALNTNATVVMKEYIRSVYWEDTGMVK